MRRRATSGRPGPAKRPAATNATPITRGTAPARAALRRRCPRPIGRGLDRVGARHRVDDRAAHQAPRQQDEQRRLRIPPPAAISAPGATPGPGRGRPCTARAPAAAARSRGCGAPARAVWTPSSWPDFITTSCRVLQDRAAEQRGDPRLGRGERGVEPWTFAWLGSLSTAAVWSWRAVSRLSRSDSRLSSLARRPWSGPGPSPSALLTFLSRLATFVWSSAASSGASSDPVAAAGSGCPLHLGELCACRLDLVLGRGQALLEVFERS